jgi:hypothetical protein
MTWSPHNLSEKQETSKILSKNDPVSDGGIYIRWLNLQKSFIHLDIAMKNMISVQVVKCHQELN